MKSSKERCLEDNTTQYPLLLVFIVVHRYNNIFISFRLVTLFCQQSRFHVLKDIDGLYCHSGTREHASAAKQAKRYSTRLLCSDTLRTRSTPEALAANPVCYSLKSSLCLLNRKIHFFFLNPNLLTSTDC